MVGSARKGGVNGGGSNGQEMSKDELDDRLRALDRCISDWLLRGPLMVEDVLSLFPEQRSLRHFKGVLVKHMEAASAKARTLVLSNTPCITFRLIVLVLCASFSCKCPHR
jgi:hypothetical protein